MKAHRNRRWPSRARVGGVVLLLTAACDSDRGPGWDREDALRVREERSEAQRQAAIAEHTQEEQALLELISGPGEPPRVRNEAELELVLDFYCGECHRSPIPSSADGLYMESLEHLISVGTIVPGNAAMSRLVSRMRAGEMPPVSSGDPPVPIAVIDAIAELVDALPVPAPLEMPPPPPAPLPAAPLPEPVVVPGAGNDRCHFEYLGDWVRCENSGDGDVYRRQKDAALEDCFEACLAQPDCTSVNDYSWLGLQDLGCDLYISTCDTPSRGDWHEEDGAREYRKVCTAE